MVQEKKTKDKYVNDTMKEQCVDIHIITGVVSPSPHLLHLDTNQQHQLIVHVIQ